MPLALSESARAPLANQFTNQNILTEQQKQILCVRCVFPSPLLPPYVGGVCFCSKLCLVFCVGGVCFCSKLCVVFCVGGVCFCVALALPSQTISQKRPIDVAKETYVVSFAQ